MAIISNYLYSKCIVLGLFLVASKANAQISADGTTSTNVNQNGNVAEITGGGKAGNNLFHSFQDFAIPTGKEAFFNNADTIENIFSRVTGGKISSIDGLIRANGGANLFLINPAGIIFGENASLDIGGSFFGSTADSLLFDDGIEFSATNSGDRPLLTVNAPIGLSFRDNTGDIKLTGTNLAVNPGQNLTLVGGDVSIDGGSLTASEGRVELGGLATAGEININGNGSLDFLDNLARGNVSLVNSVFVDVSGSGGGAIAINANNFEILSGSVLLAGIRSNQDNSIPQAGNIDIQATDTVNISQSSSIANAVAPTARGDSGDINIQTKTLNISEGGLLNTITYGEGNAGNINIEASDKVSLNGADDSSPSNVIISGVAPQAIGNGGIINIKADSLSLANGAVINSGVFGQGNGGDISLQVEQGIQLNNLSLISSSIEPGGMGNSGDIDIAAQSLAINDGGQVISEVARSRDGFPGGNGQGGNIRINTTNFVSISGFNKDLGASSSLITSTERGANGAAGNISIDTTSLAIADGATIESLTRNNSNGGNITIDATTSEITNGGQIITTAFDGGDAGNINLNISDRIKIAGSDSNFDQRLAQFGDEVVVANQGAASGLFANATSNATGSGGNISIQTNNLTLDDRATLSASTASGKGGNITLSINDILSLSNNSTITAQASQQANGGNVDIGAKFILAFPSQNNGNDILASAEAGQGGNIKITTRSLFGIQKRPQHPLTNDLDASSDFGLDGNISINTLDMDAIQTDTELPDSLIESEQTVAQACQINRDGRTASGLIVKGKGGIPPQPTEPFGFDGILVNGRIAEPFVPAHHSEIEAIKSEIGIIPARGVMITELGEVVLTAYPTDKIDTRTPQIASNCG